VRIWDARTGAPITSELVHSSGPKYANFSQKVNHVAFSADSKLLATTSSDETTRLWDATTGAPVASPIGGTGSHLAFSPGSRWIATAAMSGLVRLWDVRTGAAVSPPWMHESSATHVAFDASGSRLLSAGLDGTVRIVSLLLDERPPDVIRRWAAVLACQRVDEMGGLVELTVDELRERWDALMAPSSR
jgi:dipeptidyl aminopeptidase/acylaminoacyl peptidase